MAARAARRHGRRRRGVRPRAHPRPRSPRAVRRPPGRVPRRAELPRRPAALRGAARRGPGETPRGAGGLRRAGRPRRGRWLAVDFGTATSFRDRPRARDWRHRRNVLPHGAGRAAEGVEANDPTRPSRPHDSPRRPSGTRWPSATATTRLPRAVREQRAALADLRGDRAEAERLRARPNSPRWSRPATCYLVGSQLARARAATRDALKHLRRATELDPENFSAWFVRGTAHLRPGAGRTRGDVLRFVHRDCAGLRPGVDQPRLRAGAAAGSTPTPATTTTRPRSATRIWPRCSSCGPSCARRRGDRDGAIEDYTRALATGTAPARVHFKRATAKFHKGDKDGAKADREAGFAVTPDRRVELGRARREPLARRPEGRADRRGRGAEAEPVVGGRDADEGRDPVRRAQARRTTRSRC